MEGFARKALAGAVTLTLACASAATADPAGKTTLNETIKVTSPTGFAGFKSIGVGPGEPYLVRTGGLGSAKSGRAAKRRTLVFFAQFSDVHIRDTQSPARVDFVDPAGPPLDSAWRGPGAPLTPGVGPGVGQVNA